MSKRFTESEKWRDKWYRALKPKHKLLWSYLTDSCDQAGIIDPDWELVSFQVGEKYSSADIDKLGARVIVRPNGKLWIPSFIPFQYGKLSRDCKPHAPVFAALERAGITVEEVYQPRDKGNDNLSDTISKGIEKGINTNQVGSESLQEKEKEEDKEGGAGGNQDARDKASITADTIYSLYPRKEGRAKAIESIHKAMRLREPAEILERTALYAKIVARWREDRRQFIPHPATWYNQGRYDDDPEVWARNGNITLVEAGLGQLAQPRLNFAALVEPIGWQAFVDENYPTSDYAKGRPKHGCKWEQVESDHQDAITRAMAAENTRSDTRPDQGRCV